MISSQKCFCDFVCVWFSEKYKSLKNSLKNNTQSNIYARSHNFKKHLIDKIFLCDKKSQKKKISIRYLSDNYKIVRGVVV